LRKNLSPREWQDSASSALLHLASPPRHAVPVVVAPAVAVAVTATAQTLPEPTGAINDFAGVLNPPSRAALTTLVEAIEKDSSAEIAVATVSSLDGFSTLRRAGGYRLPPRLRGVQRPARSPRVAHHLVTQSAFDRGIR
jgi:hypothetical protein